MKMYTPEVVHSKYQKQVATYTRELEIWFSPLPTNIKRLVETMKDRNKIKTRFSCEDLWQTQKEVKKRYMKCLATYISGVTDYIAVHWGSVALAMMV